MAYLSQTEKDLTVLKGILITEVTTKRTTTAVNLTYKLATNGILNMMALNMASLSKIKREHLTNQIIIRTSSANNKDQESTMEISKTRFRIKKTADHQTKEETVLTQHAISYL